MVAPSPTSQADSPYKLARVRDPHKALGLTVSYLMTKPAYAHVRFNSWARILVGQINRGHYVLVLDQSDAVVGLLGWALADEAGGQAWMQGRAHEVGNPAQGDCIIFNVWAADTLAINAVVFDAARTAMTGKRFLFYRRFYPDGRAKPVKLLVNRFVDSHLRRRAKTNASAD